MRKKLLLKRRKKKWIDKRNYSKNKLGFLLKNKFNLKWLKELLIKKLLLRNRNKMQNYMRLKWLKRESFENKMHLKMLERKSSRKENYNNRLQLKLKKLKKRQ